MIDWDKLKVESQNIPIEGELLMVRIELPHDQWQQLLGTDVIKQQILSKMCEQILQSKLCEFTHMRHAEFDTVQINARVYLAPDDQVRLLRQVITK